tara:strand:- start:573 stop:1235 length:663 start_codon:yes stop_codon:yes gene_type:complete
MSYFKQLWKKDIIPKEPVVITPSQPRPRNPLSPGAKGVDISHHNESVDISVLEKNVDFIYMKATEGINFVSSTYKRRAKQIKIPWGAYHYYRVKHDPVRQAEHFLKYIDVKSGLPPVLDIEAINNNYKDKHTADILLFLKTIEKETGLTPMIYTSYYYARDVIKPSEEFKRYPLWLAWYTYSFDKVKCPEPWDNIKVWQCSEAARVEGVRGDVDYNKVMS